MKFSLSLFLLLGACTLSGSATVDANVECNADCDTQQADCVTVCKQECIDAGGSDTDTVCDEDCDTTCGEEYEECTVTCESVE